MISDSARSTTAAESRFRVQAPNAAARCIVVIGLDPACCWKTRPISAACCTHWEASR
jgi:hypothetical protein